MPDAVERVIALGASNLTRGFHRVVSTARRRWGGDVEVLAALGHGRSYGARSQFLARTLPGILESELWDTLAQLPPAVTRGLITDIGNDILYGYPAPQVLAWVEQAVDRLQQHTRDLVITDLPLDNIRALSQRKFLFFRSLFVPRCRLTQAQVVDAAAQINEGLAALATRRGLRFVRLDAGWYGLDPIHMRIAAWSAAWQEILCGVIEAPHHNEPVLEAWRLYLMRPQRETIFGTERVSPQTGLRLARGGRVWLF
jgi:hypothetical protein